MTSTSEPLSLPPEHLASSFIQLPNDVIDVLLPAMRPNHYTVLLTIIRNTHGRRRKDWDALSHDQIAAATGLSERSVQRSLAWLEAQSYVAVKHSHFRTKNWYAVRWDTILGLFRNAKCQPDHVPADAEQRCQLGTVKAVNLAASKRHTDATNSAELTPYKHTQTKKNKNSLKHSITDTMQSGGDDLDPFADGPVQDDLAIGPTQGQVSAAFPPLGGDEEWVEVNPLKPTEEELAAVTRSETGIDDGPLPANVLEIAHARYPEAQQSDPGRNVAVGASRSTPPPISAPPPPPSGRQRTMRDLPAREEIRVGQFCTREQLLASGWSEAATGYMYKDDLEWVPRTGRVQSSSDWPF